MMVIRAGSFVMGSPPDEPGRKIYEGPQHRVEIPRAFALSRDLVTFNEWDACAAERGCRQYHPPDQHLGRGEHPVINVSWNDAQNYVAWLSAKTGKSYRLPSEAEWEYAARAGTTTPYYQGYRLTTDQAKAVAASFHSNSATSSYAAIGAPIINALVGVVNAKIAAGATQADTITAGSQVLANAPSAVNAAVVTSFD